MISLLLILILSVAPPAGAPLPAPPQAPPSAGRGLLLRYDPPLGQIAEYRVALDVRGEQTSLGERRPVQWRGELSVTEEVVAKAVDGTIWLRVRERVDRAVNITGALAGAMPAEWPAVQMRITPLGEVVEVSVATGEAAAGPRQRALVLLAAQPGLTVLPAGPVEPQDEWQADTADGQQVNELVSLEESHLGTVALIASRRTAGLALAEGSSALGLQTNVSGLVTQESALRLLVDRGLVLAHTGQTRLQTNSVASLDLPGGTEAFDIQADLTVDFDVQLIALDGRPPGGS